MHWEVHDYIAVACGIALALFATAPRLGIADRICGLLGGLAFAGYGIYAAQDGANFRLPSYAFALPVIGMLWMAGSMRVPAAPPRAQHRPGDKYGPGDERERDFDLMLSPALWSALPPPPISPAAGVSVPPPPLAPPERSLFIPAMPRMPVLPSTPARLASPSGICERCGRGREPDANFCAGCGRAFTAFDASGAAQGLPEIVRVGEADNQPPPEPEPEPEPPASPRITLDEQYRLRDLHGEY